jgi:formylglycine-generating enzyme required for sulfatase activity
MDFSLEDWKKSVAQQARKWGQNIQRFGVKGGYALAAFTAMAPLMEGLKLGADPAQLTLLMTTLVGGIGSNLLAEIIQRWKDKADTPEDQQKFLTDLTQKASQDPELAKALEQIVDQLAVPVLQEILNPTARAEILSEIQREKILVREGRLIQVVWTGDYVAAGGTKIVNMPDSDGEKRRRARQNYLEGLTQRYGQLTLPPLSGQEQKNINLSDVYIDLNTLPDVVFDDEGSPSLHSSSVLEVVQQESRLVILGAPGGGKSTFVNTLIVKYGIDCLESKLPLEWSETRIPVLTALRDMTKDLNTLVLNGSLEEKQRALLNLLKEQWRRQLVDFDALDFEAELYELLRRGNVLLVFDGLDEITVDLRVKVRQLIQSLETHYPKIKQIIITCRVRSYTGLTRLTKYQDVTLDEFTEEQIRNFINAWYQSQAKHITSELRSTRITDLTIAALNPLKELSGNPLLLTTMAMIHQQETRLPDERAKLYAKTVELLLARWQQHKGIKVSEELGELLNNTGKLRDIMERVAYETHQLQSRNVSGDMSRGDLWVLLEDPLYFPNSPQLVHEFIDYVDTRAGILVGIGGDEEGHKPPEYTFPHRTLQEYLAGCYMVRGTLRVRGIVSEYTKRAEEGDFWQVAVQLGAEEILHERRDQSKLLDLAYDLYPKSLENTGSWRRVLWCAQMVQILGKGTVENDIEAEGKFYLTRLRDDLVALLESDYLPPIERVEAGRLLGELGDPRSEVTDVNAMMFCWIPRGRFWTNADGFLETWYLLDYDYWLAKYPVTQAQFNVFIDSGGYHQEEWWSIARKFNAWSKKGFKASYGRSLMPVINRFPYNIANYPIADVSWLEALAYTEWLTKRWQLAEFLPEGWQVTLPNMYEWEKGARGGEMILSSPWVQSANMGLTSPNNLISISNPNSTRRYPWGDMPNSNFANYNESYIGTPNAVGCFSKGESVYGCNEMSGNVWEFLSTLEGEEENDKSMKDPVSLIGGGFSFPKEYIHCGAQITLGSRSAVMRGFGFRLAVIPSFPFIDSDD